MTQLILIDATNEKETVVVSLNEGKIESIDSQNSDKRSKNNNIYLAKVVSIVPSLQAAFIDYGDGLNGFLPFSEIHPDYYQIPVSDREKLLEEMSKTAKAINHDESVDTAVVEDEEVDEEIVSNLEAENIPHKSEIYKRYKIQEVIKKEQVLLVQVEKEERGHKGAALTTYISLAGRYCVLMPNATKGGGVSKKISDPADRSRLKKLSVEVAEELSITGSIIIRTAGSFKTKQEIHRDCAYLQTLWDQIRGHTIKSHAPTFIYEESDVIKQTIRDVYHNDIAEILVQGKKAYNDAKEFMSALLPKHVHKLKLFNGKQSLFAKYQVDEQIAQLYSNRVELKSGGYIVINQTEALVTIDVNSGRTISERNIEDTAVKTNIEAAIEISRQLILRNLSGLIVIDFIDMDERRNKKAVEKSLKEALMKDKARIQIGKISYFGLLEMSRQRTKYSFIEANTLVCGHCQGRGVIRQSKATALAILKAIEKEIVPAVTQITVFVCSEVASYMLNYMRKELSALDDKFIGNVVVKVDEAAGGDGFFVEKSIDASHNKSVKALSNISASTDEIVEEVAENIEVKANTIVPKKNKNKKRRNKVNKDKQVDESSNTVANVAPSEIDEKQNKKKWKKKYDDVPKIEQKTQEDDVAIDDEEIIARRKANQSLLREIWKKIVE